jgi:hypothetical protein
MIIDVNVNLSRWPFRRTPCDELPRLIETLSRHGVRQAWTGSLDGLFHRDIGGVNIRLAEDCRRANGAHVASRGDRPELVPFGSVNPMLPDWQEDVRRCHEIHRMPGIRLHPGFHGYRLDEPVFVEMLEAASRRGLVVQLALRMDDVRVQHPLIQVPDIDAKPLARLVKSISGLRLVVLNGLATLRGGELQELAAAGRVWFDIATQEHIAGVADLLRVVGSARVLFGSHLPLFPLESALLKVREAGLEDSLRRAVECENAQGLLPAGKS